MRNEFTLTRGKFKRNLPFYEVKHQGQTKRFSGKTKAFAYANSISNNLFNPNNIRIDIVNTQTGETWRYQ